MKLVINTQYRENYAAHNDDFVEGVSQDHWKFKGGTTYVVENITPPQARNIEMDGIPELTKLVSYSNSASEEYILGYDIVEDDAVVCEEWETPIVLAFDRDHQEWTAMKVTHNGDMGYMRSEIKVKTEKWTMLPENDRADYSSSFLMADGQILSYAELGKYFELEAA
tara:strand:+ start:1433 stop:1933 length:501 start_codon:yes stop_codon:yes gene_type:complete